VLVILGIGSLGAGQAPQQGDGKPEDKQVVDAKAEKRSSAAAIDFRKELNLPYPSLGTLGSRIESARKAYDPVALAHTANELAVAEKVSGKKASLTSTAVLKESAELAKLRREAAELKAVLQVQQQVANEDATVAELKKQIASAEEFAKAETASVLRGEEPTGQPRKVLINNYSTQWAGIAVNGNFKTVVPPAQSKWIVIEHKWDPTVLTADGNEDLTHWPKRIIWGNFKTYTWNLH
jgi:hypothetical protein